MARSIEVKMTDLTFEELIWLRETLRRNEKLFTTELDITGASGTLDTLPNSKVTLTNESVTGETFQVLGEIMNYFQTAKTNA